MTRWRQEWLRGCLPIIKQGHPIGQPCYLKLCVLSFSPRALRLFSRFLCALCEIYFFSPNFSTASSRILYFKILPAAFIGNDLTKSI